MRGASDRSSSARPCKHTMPEEPEEFWVLVCGGRDYGDWNAVYRELDAVLAHRRSAGLPDGGMVVLEGGATGADRFARWWATERGISFHEEPAEWGVHGRSAGIIRNQKMVEMSPDLCIAFPGGRGTADMVSRCRRQGIPVKEVRP